MYKPIAKQLKLDERQAKQLKLELESQSWLYSSSVFKRALACYGYVFCAHLVFALPFILASLAVIATGK